MPGSLLRVATLTVLTVGCEGAPYPPTPAPSGGLDFRHDASTGGPDDAGADGCFPSCGAILAMPPGPTCTIPIPCGLLSAASQNLLDVFAGATFVPRDTMHLDGWDYVDATDASIELYGDACVSLQNGTFSSLAIEARCPVP